MKKLNKLTAKQESFCQEYMIDLNATQAAIRAGYSEHTAKDIGCQNLAKLNISDRISDLKALRSKKVQVKAEDILRQLDTFRNARIDDYIELKTIKVPTEHGEVDTQVVVFKDFKDLTDEQLTCIESVKVVKGQIELKLQGKNWTIDQINKHIGFYEKDNQLNITDKTPPKIVFEDMYKDKE